MSPSCSDFDFDLRRRDSSPRSSGKCFHLLIHLRHELSADVRANQTTSQLPIASWNPRMATRLKRWRQLHLLKAFKALSNGTYSTLSISSANAALRARCLYPSSLSAVINRPAKALFSKLSRKSPSRGTIISVRDSPQKSSYVGQRRMRSRSK